MTCECIKIILEALTKEKNKSVINWFTDYRILAIIDELIEKIEETIK